MGLHPGCDQGQGQGQRSRDTDTFLITRKSLLLPQTWLDRHQTCTRLSPLEPASRMCSRSTSRSKVTWYGRFCDVTKCLLYSTSDVPSLHALTLWSTVRLHSPSSISVRQLHVLSTSRNELLRHWRSAYSILLKFCTVIWDRKLRTVSLRVKIQWPLSPNFYPPP